MQIYNVTPVSFGAKIIPSEYLNKAIDLAKSDIEGGTKSGYKRASTFFNSLRTIELDGSKKQLYITENNNNLPPTLHLDGTKRFIEIYRDSEHKTGTAVQEAINSMAESKYFRGEMRDDAQKVNLSYAFDLWKM